jgi:hypothetical protein
LRKCWIAVSGIEHVVSAGYDTDFAKQIHDPSSRSSNSPPNPLSVSRNRLAIPPIDSLTYASCWRFSRSKVHRCIPFGRLPGRLRIPGSQRNRCRIVSARRVARSSSDSRWQS